MVPALLAKAIESSVPADQISDLLKKAAAVCSTSPEELKELCETAINGIIDSILEYRLPTTTEIYRLGEILRALEGALGTFGSNEKVVKAVILTELCDGRIPELIKVVDPLPIDLAATESVLWIMESVRCFIKRDEIPGESRSIPTKSSQVPSYLPPKTITARNLPAAHLANMDRANLILTNRGIYLVFDDKPPSRMLISQITSIDTYSEGLCITYGRKSPVLLLEDPWFIANALLSLIKIQG